MASPSKKARKARHRNQTSLQNQVLQLKARLAHVTNAAINSHDQSAHLAKILACVVAKYGDKGTLSIPDRDIATMPRNAALREHYDQETDSMVFTAVIVKPEGEAEEPAPAIEVVTPKIEIVGG